MEIMANAKTIILDSYSRNLSVYVIVTRESDGRFLDDTGAFAISLPTFPSMVEDSVIPARYNYSTTATIWDDGRYFFRFHQMVGSVQDLDNDVLVGYGQMSIQNDQEIDIFSPERTFGGEGT